MVSWLVRSSPEPAVWVPTLALCGVFRQDILLSQSFSPLRSINGLGKPNKLRGSDLRWTSIPSRGCRKILLATSCHRNQDKLRSYEPSAPRLHFFLSVVLEI